jgi:hypothetical protein
MSRRSTLLAVWIVSSVAWVLAVTFSAARQEEDLARGVATYRIDASQKLNEFCHGHVYDRPMDLTRYSERQLFDTAAGFGLIQPRGPLYVSDGLGLSGNPKPWVAVIQSADFQKMSAADRESERQQYFQNDVRPLLFDRRLAQDAKVAFDAAYGASDVSDSLLGRAASVGAIPARGPDGAALPRNTIEEAYYLFSKCALARLNMNSANRPILQHVSMKSAAPTAIIPPIAVLLIGLMGSYIFVRSRRRAHASSENEPLRSK